MAQGWRPDAYKAFAACDASRVHVLTFDYRGFGRSTGIPSEEGLIEDGMAVVKWALQVAHVPAHRIVLVGHSLGTAVVTAVLERLSTEMHDDLDFAGLVLISAFSDIPNLMKTYMIGGFIPVLSPLKPYPRLEKLVSGRIVDKWNTTSRLYEFAKRSRRTRIIILHAKNDYNIGWKHSDVLFEAAVLGMKSRPPSAMPRSMPARELSADGNMARTWSPNGQDYVKQTILGYGGVYALPLSH